MSIAPLTYEVYERLSEEFHGGRPAGTVTKRIRLEVKTPNNATVLHVFEDDVPFELWLIAQHHRFGCGTFSFASSGTNVSSKGLTAAHYRVLVGMSPAELSGFRDRQQQLRQGVPTPLQLALALGRPDLAKCLAAWDPVSPGPCELETLYPLSDLSAYALTLRRLRDEEGDLKRAYEAVATEIEDLRLPEVCGPLRKALDEAHARRHGLRHLLPYLMLFLLLSFSQQFFHRRPVDDEVLNAKEFAIRDCNGDGFACSKAVNVGVVDPVTMCGNSSLQSPCLYQTYVTHTSLYATTDPFQSGQRYRVTPGRRAGPWEHRTYETSSNWKCRFDTTAIQQAPPSSSPVRYTHTVTCSGPVEVTLLLLLLACIAGAGVFSSLLRDLGTWGRGHPSPTWRDRAWVWIGAVSDVAICAAVVLFTFAHWPREEPVDPTIQALGRLATTAAVLCVPQCMRFNPVNNANAAFAVYLFGMMPGLYVTLFVLARERVAALFGLAGFLCAAAVTSVFCPDQRKAALLRERRVAYLEEALAGGPVQTIFDFKPIKWGTYGMTIVCLVFLALQVNELVPSGFNAMLNNPTCDWESGCVIDRSDEAAPNYKVEVVEHTMHYDDGTVTRRRMKPTD